MTKYKVKTHELQWVWGCYEVEAESEEEAIELVSCGEGYKYSDYDCTDQVDIESIELIDD